MNYELKNEIGISIFRNHIIFHGDGKTQHPTIDELLLHNFTDIELRWDKYQYYLLRTQHMVLRKNSDYEGFLFEDFYEIYYGAESAFNHSADILISITFNSAYENDYDYDYVAMASRDTATAYKSGRGRKPEETRFKISRAVIKHKDGKVVAWIKSELVRLKEILNGLYHATQNLGSWAESAIDMRVFFTNLGCRSNFNPAILLSNQLLVHANNGLSLDDLKRKLKCKVCGARCSHVKAA